MKIRNTGLLPLCVLGGALVLAQVQPAQAQSTITPGGNGRFYVELKDATLADALELVFKAAGNPSHIVDEAAKQVRIGSITFNNVNADSIIRQLANQNNFLVKKNAAGATVIEPRAPIMPPEGMGMPGDPGMVPGVPGMPPGMMPPGAPGGARPGNRNPRVPANPFGVSLETDAEATTIANAQFGNNRNNNRGNNRNSRNRTQLNPEGTYQLLVVRHTYAGGIARLFANGDVIPTELLVYPESAASGSGSGGMGTGGQVSGFGGGGRGGMGGGMGGSFGGGMGGGISGGGIGSMGGGSSGGGIGFSDRDLKENFSTVDSRSVLERVAGLPIQEWNYKQQDASIRHIGPMAQDFSAAFGVGEDDRRINFIDANGVALASIQALYVLTKEQAAQIAELKKQVEALKQSHATAPQLPVVTQP